VTATPAQFCGCILGLALGDALNAPHEGRLPERLLWRLIGKTARGERRWTDDTQMSIDVIESVIDKGTIDPDDLAARFAASYKWSRGYGPATSKLLKRIARGQKWSTANTSIHKGGSFGNGAAMRAPIVGLFYAHRPDELDDAARRSAIVTHAHPLGIEGAILIARATAASLRGETPTEILRSISDACKSEPFATRLALARQWLATAENIRPIDISRELGNGVAATDSSITAIYLALRFRDASFTELQHTVAKIGGDADTIGAMSGALWGAAHGSQALPPEFLQQLEQREKLQALASALHARRVAI
jgi:poly(ADP-ribose) glycohydrolase ARH3